MSRLVAFYRGQMTDTQGRSLNEVWAWDDDSLEAVHDFIQWLFPLPEPSRFNRDAPLLAAADIATFRGDENLRANLRTSFERILTFLGLALGPDGAVEEAPNFAARAADVWSAPNHNWLRVTRILRSLTLLGLGHEAQALHGWLETAYRGRRFPIDEVTFGYWGRAIHA
jgi:hypothetical protein